MDSVGTTLTVLKDQIYPRFFLGLKRQYIKSLVLKDHLLTLNIYNSWIKIFINLLSIGYLEGASSVIFTTFFLMEVNSRLSF